MVPKSLLNQVRRDLVTQLDLTAAAPPPRAIAAEPSLPTLLTPIRQERQRQREQAERSAASDLVSLSVLCRRTDQIEAAVALGMSTIYADYQDIKEYAAAVAAVRRGARRSIWPRPGSRSPSRPTCSATWPSWGPTAFLSATREGCTSALSDRSRSSPTSRSTRPIP